MGGLVGGLKFSINFFINSTIDLKKLIYLSPLYNCYVVRYNVSIFR